MPNINATWQPLGPRPIDTRNCATCINWFYNSGRVTAIAVNPTNSNEVWIGTADGGLWHSRDGGNSWVPATDSQSSLAIGAIAIDPNHPGTIYAGTGEANHNGDGYWGVGILKTTDDGTTWSVVGGNAFSGLGIARIAVDPDANNSSTLLVAASYERGTLPSDQPNVLANMGIWRSTDGGATWAQVLSDSSSPYFDGGTDVVFDPAQPSVAFAGLGNIFGIAPATFRSMAGVYESIDTGAHWTPYSGASGIPAGNAIARVSLALSSGVVPLYAVLTDAGSLAGGSTFGDLLNGSIYLSADATSWTALAVPASMANDDGEHQWEYESAVAVDPSVSTGNILYVGGVDLWQTTNGGGSWTNYTGAYSGTTGVHPDQHALAFLSASASQFYLGNDGGIWKGDSSQVVTNLNRSLNITQFYGGAFGDVGSRAQLYGGTQDNGEVRYPGSPSLGTSAWQQVYGGDSGTTVVDPTNNSIVYMTKPDGVVLKSTDSGQNWSIVTNEICASGCSDVNFVMPLTMFASNHTELYAVTDRVYRTTNGAANWSAISPVLDATNCSLDPQSSMTTCPLSAVAVSPSTDRYIYAGDDGGNIYVSTDGGATWSGGSVPGSTGSMVTSLAVDPRNPNAVYATFAGFGSATGQHVFRSSDAGATWSDISGALPNIPFESALVLRTGNMLQQNPLIVGSDAGIFMSTNLGVSWSRLGANLPNAAVDQLFTNGNQTQLFVATHGRGMWRLPLASVGAVSGATSYVGAGDGFLYAYAPSSGTLLWRYQTGSGIVSSPTLANGLVYFGSKDDYVYALNATTGALVWRYQTGGLVESSPSIVNGVLYVGSTDSYLYALDATTGTLIWRYLTGSRVEGSPAVANGIVYVGAGGTLYAVNTSNGTLAWSFNVTYPNDVRTRPVIANGLVYFGSSGSPCYVNSCSAVYALNASTGILAWNRGVAGPVSSSPALSNGALYIVATDQNVGGSHLYAFDALLGTPQWVHDLPNDGGPSYIGSTPAVVNGLIYLGTGSPENSVDAFDASSGALVWSYQTGNSVLDSPTVVGGVVYIGGIDRYLYALDAAAGTLDWRALTGGQLTSSPVVG